MAIYKIADANFSVPVLAQFPLQATDLRRVVADRTDAAAELVTLNGHLLSCEPIRGSKED